MKLQKAQLRLIILLNAVLAVLVAAIALECILGDRTLTPPDAEAETPVVSDTPKPEYSLVRKARLSLSDAIDLETNIGGSGDEALVDAFALSGKLYIFGNSSSSDFDMTDAQGRAFMCVTDEDLSTERFSFLGSGEKLERVIFGEGGFLTVFSHENKLTLRLINFEGNLVASAHADTVTAAEFCDVKLFDGKYGLISSLKSKAIDKNKLLLQIFDFELRLTYERIVSSAYSLSYIDCFELSGAYKLFFNASSDLGRHAGVADCTSATQPEITYVEKGEDYRADAVAPYSSGWAMAVVYRDEGGIMLLDGNFRKQSVVYCESLSPSRAELMFADGLYYSTFFTDEGSVTYAYDANFSEKRDLPSFGGLNKLFDCVSGNGYALFLGKSESKLAAIGSAETYYCEFAGDNADNAKLIKSGDNIFVAAVVNGVNADAKDNFGGADVWLARLRM